MTWSDFMADCADQEFSCAWNPIRPSGVPPFRCTVFRTASKSEEPVKAITSSGPT